MPADSPVPPWRSYKVWFAVLGTAALVALAIAGTIDLPATELAAVFVALIAGRAWEGSSARRGG